MTAVAASAAEKANEWQLASPDGKVVVTLGLMQPKDMPPYPADKVQLYYRIEQGAAGKRVEVLPWSPLGLMRSAAVPEEVLVTGPKASPTAHEADSAAFAMRRVDLVDGLRPISQSKVREIDEAYQLVHGKSKKCRSLAREQSFVFESARHRFGTKVARLEVVFRVANDGVAFRYHLPGEEGKPAIAQELTGFRLPADATGWIAPYSDATMYTPAYEEYYQKVKVGESSPKKAGWAFPALFQLRNGRWIMLTDAAVDGNYCGCRLEKDAKHGLYQLRFPDAAEGWHQGAVEPSSKLPWTTPWRVVMVAESLAGIVESTLITDLNPPSRVADTSWIKPGRAAWSWWSDHDSPTDFGKQKQFVDLAAEMGWEYVLVDANWDLMDGGDVRELARYAKEKGVALWLWYNSGGDHNIVTEKPRGTMNLPEVRKFELDLLKKWGIAGIKIDFFQSDKQNIMALYHDILRDAAEKRIMINFHGCTLTRGWQRTWPHLMTMEGVRGAECYTFAKEFPQEAPAHNCTVPFTRNVMGPMDYTPCALSDDKYPHITTNAHELALCVVFESSVLHFADRVSAYRDLPPAPKQYLKDIPVVWDEVKLVDGVPGEFVVIARRHGDDWYLAAINGQKASLKKSVALKFLGDGSYTGTLITDGDSPRKLADRQVKVTAGDTIDLNLLPYGGAVVRLKK